MIRLYSGTYLRVSGLARAMPLSISGTNCLGSLTNFFTGFLHDVVSGWLRLTVLTQVVDVGRSGQLSAIRSAMMASAIAPASTEPMLRSPV